MFYDNVFKLRYSLNGMFIFQKKGLSGIVLTVLLITLTLAAVILVWSFVRPTLNSLSNIDSDVSDRLSPVISQDAGYPPQTTNPNQTINNTLPLQNITNQSMCNQCNDWMSCGRNECSSLMGCFYYDSGIEGFSGDCFACAEVVSCEDYGDDRISCEGDDYYWGDLCGFSDCVWDETSESCSSGINLEDLNESVTDECGDDICSETEECTSCSADCGTCPVTCGNGVIDAGEQCDDGNTTSGDGCSASCTIQCLDSDGGVTYYTAGIVTIFNANNQKETYNDFCNSNVANGVMEYSCNSNTVVSNSYVCPYGCSNSACMVNPDGYGGPYCASTNDPKCGGDDFHTQYTL